MARIWYSVLGDGMGHAIRSETVLVELMKRHTILITAQDTAYNYLKRRFPNVHEIKSMHLIYKNNRVTIRGTVRNHSKYVLTCTKGNYQTIRPLVKEFGPDIIISDFESNAMIYSRLFNIPCISLNNIQTLTECKVELPKEKRAYHLLVKGVLNMLFPPVDRYIIPDFTGAVPLHPKKTRLVKPIIRKEVSGLTPSDSGSVLVYQTTETNKRLIPLLCKTSRHYKVYGMGRVGTHKNIEFCPFSPTGFLNDLASCEYVIINGGFTVISEALYLKKPILCIPIKKQIEQFFNGYALKRKGYGSYTEQLTTRDLAIFEKNLPLYRERLRAIPLWDNSELFDHLETVMKQLIDKNKLTFKIFSKRNKKTVKNINK